MMCPVSAHPQENAEGGSPPRRLPPSVSTCPSRAQGRTVEHPGWVSPLQHRPWGAGYGPGIGGPPGWNPSSHPLDGTGAHRCHGSPPAPPGRRPQWATSLLLTETTVPTADFLLVWNSLPTLKSKRKNKLYLPGENFSVSWTGACNICLSQRWQRIRRGLQKAQQRRLANRGEKRWAEK